MPDLDIDRMLKDVDRGKQPIVAGQVGTFLKSYEKPAKKETKPVPQYGYEMGKRSDHPKAKSYLPKGASQSPKGDIGALRNKEVNSAFKRKIRNSGSNDPNPLHYRKPEVASDFGRNTSI